MQALLDILDGETALITVNRRLARAVTEAHGQRQLAAGALTWRTPDVISFSAWVERSFGARSDAQDAVLLSPAQERLLWEQALAESTPRAGSDEAPLDIGAAAREAARAYAIVNAWNISLDASEFGFTQESRAFQSWARGFEARCARAGRLDMGRAGSALGDTRVLGADKLPGRAAFAGFDVLTPQLQAIRSALSERGVDVIEVAPSRRKAEVSRRTFDDLRGELRAAAAWTRRALDAAPAARIGIVVPELHRFSAMVQRVFDECLVPASAVPGRAVGYRPFNLSFGRPLSRTPVVGDALLALKLGRARSELAAAGRLLRSPYLRDGDREHYARAAVDARLRDVGEPEVSLRTLAARTRGAGQRDPGFEAIRALRERAPRRQPLDHWAQFFSEWLARLGWPGGRALTSEEFQAVETFRGLLDELAGLGAILGGAGLDEALSLLLGLAEDHIFQPRADAAPVQILGALETAGLSFDKLWVMGLNDGNWPPPPDPHPFLPVTLQRRAGLPQASPEGQIKLARLRLASWLESADEVVFSCARLASDEPLRPSPLIRDVPQGEEEVGEDSDPVTFGECLQSEAPVLEHINDERGPALSDPRISGGGAGLIRDQAACPFRAFARWRLGARAVPVAASALDARIRGNLVHAVLFDFWSEVRSHAALAALSQEVLRQRVSLAVDRALERERRARPDTLRGIVAQVEGERLRTLVEAWLSLEEHRAPFQVVTQEQRFEAAVGPLMLRIRPDRVDRLQSGVHLIVDYKTGRPQVRDWFGDRPDDPQLGVYTLVFESSSEGGVVSGAAYATLRRGELGFAGLADEEGLADGVVSVEACRIEAAKSVPDWKALKEGWRKALADLAVSFASGEARVDPKSPGSTCSYCEVKPFCRIFEHGKTAAGNSSR